MTTGTFYQRLESNKAHCSTVDIATVDFYARMDKEGVINRTEKRKDVEVHRLRRVAY